MRKTLFVFMFVLIVLNAYSRDFRKSVIIQFNNAITPELNSQDIVVVGIPVLDSLNAYYGCNDYKKLEGLWAVNHNHFVVLYFPNPTIDIEEVSSIYEEKCTGYIQSITFESTPIHAFQPGDYLFSESKEHDEDILYTIHNDPITSIWRNYAWFETSNVNYGILQEHFSGSRVPVIGYEDNGWPDECDEHGYGGYSHVYHGTNGLWHHTQEYNDTYRAWQYVTGDGELALLSDGTGFYQNHPDLINQWSLDVTTSCQYNDENFDMSDWYQDYYHGTLCAGALAGEASSIQQTTLTNTSSVGVAPNASISGVGHSFGDIAGAITELGGGNFPTVITASFVGRNFNNLVQACELNDMVLVLARPYGDKISTQHFYDQWANSNSTIVVGDYNPSYRIQTRFGGEDSNGDYLYPTYADTNSVARQYTVNINAPGWGIWSTSFKPGVPVEYILTDGYNTSIAAPQVAGVVCMVKEMYPWMTAPQLKSQIVNGAHHKDELIVASASFVPSAPTSLLGAGCLSAYRSLFLSANHVRDFVYTTGGDNNLLLGKGCLIENSTITLPDGQLRVLEGESAAFENCTITIGDDAEIFLEEGATLEFGLGCAVSIGENTSIVTDSDSKDQMIYFNNIASTSMIEFTDNSFNNISFKFDSVNSVFDNCDFESSQLEFTNSTTTIDNCDMEYSNILSTSLDLDPTDSITIRNNTISNSLVPAISITSNRNVEIKNNIIENNYIGVELFETKGVDIIDNDIRHNDQGLYLYHSIITSVSGSNDISSNSNNYGNYREPQGLYAAHNCSWELKGNTQNDYQMIVNNGKGNLFFEDYSTPSPFKYNIIHTNVGTHPYLEIDEFAQSPTYYAQNNYWGTSFDPL
ncbi:MAG: S8 family serine peptidase, partial [Candidatus Zophobacter franzmannii]|nr:S8 family serine peptidase [Candidatus Zophobacter franzmannii]